MIAVIAASFLPAYLLGALPFGLIVSRFFGIRDIRNHGSGNTGATNVWRVAGFRAAAWVYACDIGKGAAAVAIAHFVVGRFDTAPFGKDAFLILSGLAAVLGHIFPVYLRFKGGKGVSTAFGAMVMLLPLESLAGLLIFGIVAATTRFMSLGSIAGVVSFASLVVVEKFVLRFEIALIYPLLAVALAALIVVAHRRNIRRLIDGHEKRFSFSTRSGETRGET